MDVDCDFGPLEAQVSLRSAVILLIYLHQIQIKENDVSDALSHRGKKRSDEEFTNHSYLDTCS